MDLSFRPLSLTEKPWKKIFSTCSQKSNEWYRYDDMRVSQRKRSEVIMDNAKDAYLFIYQLQK